MSRRPGPVARSPAMTPLGAQSLAPAALTSLAEPGDPALGALLEACEPDEILASIKAGRLPAAISADQDNLPRRRALQRALGRWRGRLPAAPSQAGLEGLRPEGL